MNIKKETVFYFFQPNGDFSEEYETYKEAVDAARAHVAFDNSPEIWKREKVAVLNQKLVVTKTK